MKRTKIVDALACTDFGKDINVKGWVRSHRSSKAVDFIALNDGSTIKNIQVVVDPSTIDEDQLKSITTGACISVIGTLVESQGAGQTSEIQCKEIEIYGLCPSDYPMQKKGQSFEYMRKYGHMRLRTNTFGAVFRIRHNMAMAIHKYFHDHGFYYFHTPLITGSDAEGAGNMFQVTTLDLDRIAKGGEVDYSADFFGKRTNLTVSGQLEGELGATALGAIYTFGPTFRAENSNTPRHLAEFWMVEPEVAFIDKDELMDLEEDFVRLTYTEGIEILQKAVADGVKFEFPITGWGMDLSSEHERYLVEEYFKRPVIMTDYPSEIKSFYMKKNPDGKTMQGTDVLFPHIGEIIGGSVREEDYDKLLTEIDNRGMKREVYDWYLDTRKYGTCPHGGFGLGFERLILFVTGMQNIRDVIPFARTPKNAEF